MTHGQRTVTTIILAVTYERGTEQYSAAASIDIFSIDSVTTCVLQFLGVRDLLVISRTNKNQLRASIRHSHVVRAALFQGGHAARP